MNFKETFSNLARKAQENKLVRQITGRIAPEDLAELTEIRAYDFYDVLKQPTDNSRYTSAVAHKDSAGTWEVRVLHGSARGAMFSNLSDVLGKNQTMVQAVSLLEKFEADKASLRRATNTTINLPHWSKVKEALAQKNPPAAPKASASPAP